MKGFTITETREKLVVNKTRKSLLYQRFILSFCVIAIAVAFSWIFVDESNPIKDRPALFWGILGVSLLLLFLFLIERFREKGFSISKENDNILVNNKTLFKREELVNISMIRYNDSEGSSLTIRIDTNEYQVTLLRGLSDTQSEEICLLLLQFLELNHSFVKHKEKWI